jgi:hypothetical protein
VFIFGSRTDSSGSSVEPFYVLETSRGLENRRQPQCTSRSSINYLYQYLNQGLKMAITLKNP